MSFDLLQPVKHIYNALGMSNWSLRDTDWSGGWERFWKSLGNSFGWTDWSLWPHENSNSASSVTSNFDALADLGSYTDARNMAYNTAEAQKQRDWQERMSNTSWQRALQDIKAAGLSPALLSSGASVGSGASSSYGGAAAVSAASSAMSERYSLERTKMNNDAALQRTIISGLFSLANQGMSNSAAMARQVAGYDYRDYLLNNYGKY